MIIKAKRGFSLQGVKRDYRADTITLKDAQHRLYTMMTTEKPKGKTSSGDLCLNRINRRRRSNYDGVRYFDLLARMLLFNSWKMNKKRHHVKDKERENIREWTLNQNLDLIRVVFLFNYKKSYGVMG